MVQYFFATLFLSLVLSNTTRSESLTASKLRGYAAMVKPILASWWGGSMGLRPFSRQLASFGPGTCTQYLAMSCSLDRETKIWAE